MEKLKLYKKAGFQATSLVFLILLGNGCGKDQPARTTDHSSAASSGGVDGSGGSGSKSTPEEIVAATQDWQHQLRNIFHRAELEIQGGNSRFEPKANEVFKGILEGTSTKTLGINELLKSPGPEIETIQTSPCIKQESAEEEACVTQSGKIFLNQEKLTRIPPSALDLELRALIGHELAHIYGFNQHAAISLQKAILKHKAILMPNPERIARLQGASEELSGMLKKIQTQLVSKSNGDEICSSLEEFGKTLSQLDFDAETDPKKSPYPAALHESLEAYFSSVEQAFGFCHDFKDVRPELARTQVPVGDFTRLIDQTTVLHFKTFSILNEISLFVDRDAKEIFPDGTHAKLALSLPSAKDFYKKGGTGRSITGIKTPAKIWDPLQEIACAFRNESLNENAPITIQHPLLRHNAPDNEFYAFRIEPDHPQSGGRAIHVHFQLERPRPDFELGLTVSLNPESTQPNERMMIRMKDIQGGLLTARNENEAWPIPAALILKRGAVESFNVAFSVAAEGKSDSETHYRFSCKLLNPGEDPKSVALALSADPADQLKDQLLKIKAHANRILTLTEKAELQSLTPHLIELSRSLDESLAQFNRLPEKTQKKTQDARMTFSRIEWWKAAFEQFDGDHEKIVSLGDWYQKSAHNLKIFLVSLMRDLTMEAEGLPSLVQGSDQNGAKMSQYEIWRYYNDKVLPKFGDLKRY